MATIPPIPKKPEDQMKEALEFQKAEIRQVETIVAPEPPLDPAQLKQVETLSGLGLTIGDTAAVLGISKRTLERRLADTPEVAEARTRGKAVANSNVAKKAYEMAKAGNVHLIKFWLATQAGWKETKKVELSGEDGGPIEATYVPPEERLKRLQRQRELLKYVEPEPEEPKDG
jgi:ECF sigma factor